MNKRQVIILWVIAIALGGAVATLKLTQKDTAGSATARASGQTLFETFPATDISTVEIQGVADSVTLAKKDGAWTVAQRDGYPANSSSVNDLLRMVQGFADEPSEAIVSPVRPVRHAPHAASPEPSIRKPVLQPAGATAQPATMEWND